MVILELIHASSSDSRTTCGTEEDAIIRFKLFSRRTVLMNLDNTSYQAERLGLRTGAIPFKSLPYQASIVG